MKPVLPVNMLSLASAFGNGDVVVFTNAITAKGFEYEVRGGAVSPGLGARLPAVAHRVGNARSSLFFSPCLPFTAPLRVLLLQADKRGRACVVAGFPRSPDAASFK